jgi:hypothetical protein
MKQPQEKLLGEWQRLQGQWQVANEKWRDLLRHRFEREFMQSYQPTVVTALKEMDKLDKVIAQARRELENLR